MSQNRTQIAELLKRHGLRPRHMLGQHFLADANVTRRIVAAAAVGPGSRVIEIGAGTGTLTVALADAGAHVVAYEVDPGLEPILREVTAGRDVDIRIEDATRVDFGAAFADPPWFLVANLPYNVGTGIVLDVLRTAPAVMTLVVMVQLEVAERMVAPEGHREYGLPSVVIGIHSAARILFQVPPQVFYPAPRVASAVVRLERKVPPPGAERAIELARAAFSRRRKMLRSSLASELGDPVAVLGSIGIDPTLRPEALAPADFLRLAKVAP
jgi:16S rRNA (adenine1518-N6/adenine1519-N6)-dimethyltransferase